MLERPLRVAVVGAGPSGMYAAGHLLNQPDLPFAIEVDVLERLPTPWGLVRAGVAPDHPEKKQVARLFESTAALPGFRFFGNVEVGRDLGPAELSQWYDAVIYAVGAAGDRRAGIPGEDLAGSHSATEFVSWYNGHPDFCERRFDLSGERAVVIGNGNVALDVARILMLPQQQLCGTDIAAHALEALAASRIREVVILGRRSALHGAFNNPELSELGELEGVDLIVDPSELPDEAQIAALQPDWIVQRKIETLREWSQRRPAGHPRRILLHFLAAPLALSGSAQVRSLRVGRNRPTAGGDVEPTGETFSIDTGLVLRAIGYHGRAIAGLPFDPARGVIPNRDGRIGDARDAPAGAYVTGWIKRGPSGIIGTNKKCSQDTVRALLDDAMAERLPFTGTLSAVAVAAAFKARKPDLVRYTGWQAIDRQERLLGASVGRPRVKMPRIEELLGIAVPASATGAR